MDMLRVDSLASARLILSQRASRDEAQVLDACEHLIAHGDWIDQARGHEVRAQIAEFGLAALNRSGRRGLIIAQVLLWTVRLVMLGMVAWLSLMLFVDLSH